MTVLTGHELPLEGVVVSTDGSRIFSVDLGGTVRAWPIGASAGVRQIDGVYRHANGIAVSADGKTIATAGGDGSLLAWVSSGLTPLLLKPPGRSTTSHNPMALTPDGRQLWVGESGLIRVWDLALVNSSTVPADLDTAPCYRPNRPIPYSGVAASLLAVSLDGRVVAIGFEESTRVVVRDVGNRAIVAAYYPTDTTEAIRSLAFRPDGSLLIASSSFPDVIPTGHIRLWDWKNNHMLATVPIQQGTDLDRPWRLAASADGSRFAIYGGWPFVVSIWDGNLTRELGRLMTQEADSVALSPDGSRIFTVNLDNAVRVWDGERFQQLLTLSDSEGHAGGVVMTPDWRLIAGRTSGGLTIWEPNRAKRP